MCGRSEFRRLRYTQKKRKKMADSLRRTFQVYKIFVHANFLPC